MDLYVLALLLVKKINPDVFPRWPDLRYLSENSFIVAASQDCSTRLKYAAEA
jgi:hypothetical protein